MAIVKDIKYLRQPCAEVTEKLNLEAMVSRLRYELKEWPGCSIAANQVHISYRVCIIAQGTMNPIVLVNPVVVKTAKPKYVNEGCLSLPNITVAVTRFLRVKVKALDENRRKVKYTFIGTQAQAVQHEIDHLDGKLMIDYLPPAEKQKAEDFLERMRLQDEKKMQGQQFSAQAEATGAQQEEAGTPGETGDNEEESGHRETEPGAPGATQSGPNL